MNAPPLVVDALVARLERQAEAREQQDRQARLRQRLRQQMGGRA